MKRLHVNLAVADLDESRRFYTALFATEPTVLKPDYAKWMLDDPRVNFSISSRGSRKGIDHLGIQVDDAEELGIVHGRLKTAGGPVVEQGATTCCYAHSEKNWTFDPEGVAWETFFTTGESAVFGESSGVRDTVASCCDTPIAADAAASCCGPTREEASGASDETAKCCA